ncbi:Trk-type K+ transport system, membrane component [Salipaludibacillus aurantiacus]|uniref:Trk-type K+ transport system, membrane component n=2 Tax=Salipaludibacillus aurantiacus TaxID=1601833 RepID=A0A1H9SKS9_9BACI|nr:Trk-type K+ transport system, membrane component [Salipaludibacillus aurantiacus]
MLNAGENKSVKLSSVQIIVLFYAGAVLISCILLSLPIALKPGVTWTFIDLLFTSVSAVSVTGLTVVNTAETFSGPGVFILAFILQFGGIGIMTLGTFIWVILGKKISFRDRQLMMIDHNRSAFSGLVRLMLQILTLFLIIEAIGTVILGIYFLNYFPTWHEAFIQGFFGSVSAATNAGFDITGESLEPFANDYFVQTINILLLIFGAIGFPVLIEVKEMLTKPKNEKFRFSLFTKITTITFFSLAFIGTVLIYVFDKNHFFAGKTWHETVFYALFQSVTTRNGGLATMDVSEFTEATQMVQSALMFIGASPSSVGGGIRTTTFAIAVLAIISFARGRQSVKLFGRELHMEDITKSFIVVSVAIMLWGSAIILLTHLESFPLMAVVYEVSSAFGTTGLSMGITSELSTAGKLIIIMLMFIGRIGIFSFLFLIRGTTAVEPFHYPKERVIIG